jgi:uncharacterized repeat protein (TIGR01451 family)/LPXTG-motif cell wall-anchored protein
MSVPLGTPPNQIAWNSYGYTATRADTLDPLVPSEPRKIGLEVSTVVPPPENPGISLLKFVNDIHAPNPPGPEIPAGSNVVFTYLVTNTGTQTLTDVTLIDSVIGTITCPKTVLAPGEKMTCTSPTEIAISGQYKNTATVTGHPPSGPPLTDTDTGHYFNGELPPTGSSTGHVVQFGAILLAIGFAFLLLSRRRREAV